MQFVLFITYISVVVYVAHTADVTTYSCVLCDLCSARRHRSEIAVKSIFYHGYKFCHLLPSGNVIIWMCCHDASEYDCLAFVGYTCHQNFNG